MRNGHQVGRKSRRVFWGILVCWAYLGFLTAVMLGVSGSEFVRPNFMFNADCIWWLRFAAGSTTDSWKIRFIRHPLLTPLVIALGSCASIVRQKIAHAYISYAAMALLVLALHIAIAVLLSMVWKTFGGLSELRTERLRLCLPMVGLSSVAFIVALPESFGIAMALLLGSWAMVFSAVCRNVSFPPSRVIAAALVCGGCTTTNALAPFISEGSRRWNLSLKKKLLCDGNRKLCTKLLQVVAGASGAFVIFFVMRGQWSNVREWLRALVPSVLWNPLRSSIKEPFHFANLRLLHEPIQATVYSLWGTVAPVIPPMPGFSEWGLTYEPVSFRQFSLFQWPGILALWAVIAYGLRSRWERHERFLAISCSAWLIWNLVFHNLWGDEFFLYSPHWVWCLWLLFGMGFSKLKPRVATLVAACVISAQLIGWVSLLRAVNIAAGGNAPINKVFAYLGQERSFGISPAYLEKVKECQADFGPGQELPPARFYLFGMGLRDKYLFSDDKLISLSDRSVFRQWEVQSLEVIPPDYRVVIHEKNGNISEIREDEQAVWLSDGSERKVLPGTERPLRLLEFQGYQYRELLRVLHHEVLIGITASGPVPNVIVYNKPWYRDAAMMAMVLKATGNLDQIRDWIFRLNEPYDGNNKEAEPDNLGQVLFLISLVSDRNHPLVTRVLAEAETRAVRKNGLKYLDGLTDGAHHPVYQTKWLKFGLAALGLPDDWTIPPVPDSYSALFWMDYRDQHVIATDASNPRLFPYLDWACAHFHNRKHAPLNIRGYPLTWEAKAGQAQYDDMHLVSPAWRIQRIAGPHGWHAAEAFLYLSAIAKGAQR
jgi:hypothetical protein